MMQGKYSDIFNDQAGANEFAAFDASPTGSVMNKLAMAGDSVSGVHTPRNNTATQESNKNKKGNDLAASAAQQLMLAQQQFNESMESARSSITEFEDTLAQAQIELDAQKAELDAITITLSDGNKAYLNTDNNQFMQQDKAGNWQNLDDDQQAEARERWEASGVSATQQDKIMIDQRQESINTNSRHIAESKAELNDVEQAVKDGVMSKDDGVEATASIEEKINGFGDEFKLDLKTTNIDPKTVMYKSQGLNNESFSLFNPAHNHSVMSDSSPFPGTDNISGKFSSAANGIQPNSPAPEPDLPTVNAPSIPNSP